MTSEELGGASAHSTKSGVAHLSCVNEVECISNIRKLLSYIPSNCEDEPPVVEAKPAASVDLNNLIPANPNQPYDIREAINGIVDEGSFFEIHPQYAENIVVGFARLNGKSIGLVCNQPAALAGVLDIDASLKGARFVRFCDCLIFRCWCSRMFRDFCRAPTRSGTASLNMERSCCMRFRKPLFPA